MVVSAVHGAEHFKGLAFSASCLAFESAASCSPSVSEDWQWSMEASCLSPAWWLWMRVQGGAFMCSLITSFYADFKFPLNKQPLLLELALCKEPLYWVVGGVLGFCSEAASAVSRVHPAAAFPVPNVKQLSAGVSPADSCPPTAHSGTQLQKSYVTEALEQSPESYL